MIIRNRESLTLYELKREREFPKAKIPIYKLVTKLVIIKVIHIALFVSQW